MSWFMEHKAVLTFVAAIFVAGAFFGEDILTILPRLDAQESLAIDHELDHRARARVERAQLALSYEERCERKERGEVVCEAQQDSMANAWAREDSLFEAEMAERLKK